MLSLPHALRFLLATDPDALTLVLGVVYRTISRHLIGKAGLTRATGVTGAVTLVQRFGSALNLNVHFHMLLLDGAYQTVGADAPVFRPVVVPESSDLQELVEQIAGRIGRALERRGLVERDLENAWLATDTEAGPLDDLLGHSITTASRWGYGPGRSCLRCRRFRPGCRDWKVSRTVRPVRAVLIAHRCGYFAESAREARTPVPLRESATGGQRAPGADGIGPGAPHAQDAVPGWHHPHRDRAAGSDGSTGGTGPDAADALDSVSRRIGAAQSASGGR